MICGDKESVSEDIDQEMQCSLRELSQPFGSEAGLVSDSGS